jgi:hypothetical protein
MSLKSYENDIIKVAIFESHVEIISKNTLKNSSSVVYEIDEKRSKYNVIL